MALLAVFGAPRRQVDHADQALAAACEIADAVDDEFQDELGVGIGLNSGKVVAGNVGLLDGAMELEERPAVPLKGKTEPVALFAPRRATQ